jgi:hypothetical protein
MPVTVDGGVAGLKERVRRALLRRFPALRETILLKAKAS